MCLSVFACTPVHSNSPTTSTDSLACFAGALTKQLSDSFVSQNMCSAPCLILTPSTRVFHRSMLGSRRMLSLVRPLSIQSLGARMRSQRRRDGCARQKVCPLPRPLATGGKEFFVCLAWSLEEVQGCFATSCAQASFETTVRLGCIAEQPFAEMAITSR